MTQRMLLDYIPTAETIIRFMRNARQLKAAGSVHYFVWVYAARRCNRAMLGLSFYGLRQQRGG